ncbi:MAG: DUF5915 domain-containing protein [Planctomycetota bacterium]
MARDVRIRQPLASLTLAVADDGDRAALEGMRDLILAELNIKEMHQAQSEQHLVSYSARPNLKVLGPAYGKQLKAIQAEVAGLDSHALAGVVAGKELASQAVDGLVYTPENLLVDRESKSGLAVATEGESRWRSISN